MRTILHLNIPSFPLELECLRFPRLRSRPLAISPPGGERAGLLSVSTVASQHGVARGMPVHRAKRICRDLIVLPADESYYMAGNEELTAIFMSLSPVVQPYRFGRIHSDLTRTARNFPRAADAGGRVLKEIQSRFRISGAIGLGSNKLVSQIVSKVGAQKEVNTVKEGGEEQFLAPLWSNYLPSVTNELWQELLELNLLRIGEIARFSCNELATVFGRPGEMIHQHSHGVDNSPVLPPLARPEINHGELLLPDSNDIAVLEAQLHRLVETASAELRDKNLSVSHLILEITYSDGKKSEGRQDIKTPLTLAQPIFALAKALLFRICKRRTRVRMIVLRLSRFSRRLSQLDLFEAGSDPRVEKLQAALENLREKFGQQIIGSQN